MLWANPAAAQTYAIVNGTVALGDGSEPIPNGTVVIRDGRIVAAGAMRMKLPAGTQVIDANDPRKRPVSDFELGQPGEGDVK